MLGPDKRTSRSNSDLLLIEMVQNTKNLRPELRMAIIHSIVTDWEEAGARNPAMAESARKSRFNGKAYEGGLNRPMLDGPELAKLIEGERNA